ncbi:MAG: hypothetical protein HQL03_05425 [Nitrospirae bacterium]|nr:hypothetical protein [Nitrospirota bacterium]MBF0592075.1 hypothetical protein [Nitrospirota bacterium]
MYKGRLIKGIDIVPYKMPTLEANSKKRSNHNPFEPLPSIIEPKSNGNHPVEIVADTPPVQEPVPDIAQIKLEIEEMRRQAIHKATTEATAEAVRIEKDAYQKGLEEGEKTGLKNAQEQTTPMVEQLSRLIQEVKTFRTKSIEGLQPQVVELAIAIAKKVVGDELATKPEIIVSVVKEALMRIDKTGHIKIKVNPAVYDLFMQHKDSIIDLYPDVGFEIDNTVSQTGPLVIGTTEEIITDIDELLRNTIEDMRDNVVIH